MSAAGVERFFLSQFAISCTALQPGPDVDFRPGGNPGNIFRRYRAETFSLNRGAEQAEA